MIPARVALALQSDGWWLRSMIPWLKKNSMPESCLDRPITSVEYIFLLTKSRAYFYDAEAVKITSSTNSHVRGTGVNPKAKACGSNSRMYVDRDVRHQNRVIKSRQNESFSAAVTDLVPSRNRRNSDWFFESLQGLLQDDKGDPLALVANPQPYKGAHYSSFPEKLVKPLIKAGTSERGCCRKCGSPWQREVDKTFVPQQDVSLDRGIRGATGQKPMDASSEWDGVPRGSNVVKTIGWQPTCSCDDGDPVPCVVLDPFHGSGTVGAVAERLNRRWVGLDLGYQGLQRERLVGIQKEIPLIG